MSRSYRKFPRIPGCGSSLSRRQGKKLSVKKTRTYSGIPDGGAYKKVFCSWKICDHRPRYSLAQWLKGGGLEDIDKRILEWKKIYLWK